MKFKKKLYMTTLGSLALLLVLMILTQIYAVNSLSDEIEQTMRPSINEQATRIALLESQRYAEYIEGMLTGIKILTQANAISIAGIYSKKTFGMGISNTNLFDEEIIRQLTELKNSNPNIINAYYATEDGKLFIVPPAELPDDYDARESSWYKEAAQGKDLWLDPYTDKITGKTVITYVMPVKVNGKIKGVLGVDIDVSPVMDAIKNTKLGKTGYIFIVNREGTIIFHPNEKYIGKLNIKKEPSLQKLAEAVFSGKHSGITTYTWQGVEKVAAFSKSETTDWVLIAAAPKKELVEDILIAIENAKADSNKILLMGLAFAIAISGVILLINMRLLNTTIRPITQLTKAAELIAHGRLEEAKKFVAQVRYSEEDEIGKLLDAFRAISEDVITTLNGVIDKLEAMARGELNYSVSEEAKGDLQEIITALKDTSIRMRSLIKSLVEIGHELDSRANMLARIANDVSESINQVNEAVQQVSVEAQRQQENINEITEGMRMVADVSYSTVNTMNEFEEALKEVVTIAEEGKEKSEVSAKQVQSIQDTMKFIEDAVNAVDEMSKSISEITNTISTIAEQTNLLALNAAIEAARAGEQGRGFAVVAQEVRNLAEESKKAADNIKEIVEKMTQKVHRAVEETKNGVHVVNESAQTLNETIHYLTNIADLMGELNYKVTEIKEQTLKTQHEIDESLKAIENLAASAEETTASAEEVSSAMEEQTAAIEELKRAAEELKAISKELKSNIQRFKL